MSVQYNLPADEKHKGILMKFNYLKGELFYGQKDIKGVKGSGRRLPPDEFVQEEHMLHDLIRGFYKPKGEKYMLSYQATEVNENYGRQIEWINEEEGRYAEINMSPPRGERDNRAKSDIQAARYNMENKIPIGILHKLEKGINRCLGLGVIERETNEGVFIVKPIFLPKENILSFEYEESPILENTDIDLIVKGRIGQSQFKRDLIRTRKCCQICELDKNELLIGSHIKPWRKSNSTERLDRLNGLLLCPNHDFLFDKGYISFTDSGNILISNLLEDDDLVKLNITFDDSISVYKGQETYLSWHRENIFKN